MYTNLHNQLTKIPKIFKSLIIGLMVLAVPAVSMAYGPDRPTYDYNKFDSSKPCTDPANSFGRCGSMTGPVFNSFANGPGYGDERNFNRISEAVDGNPIDDNYSDNLQAQVGKEYWVRIYVHNNSNQTLNCSVQNRTPDGNNCAQIDAGSPGIATGTTVRLDFDKGRANGHDIKAYVKANNAEPREVYDDAQLNNDSTKFRLEYVAGSAKALTAKQNTTMQPVSDDIAGPNGTALGQDFNGNINASGNFPGCFEFTTRVYVKVVVKAPIIKVVKKAYISGTTNMVDGQTVKPTDNITWKAYFFNIGNDAVLGATMRDRLPKDNKFIAGTLKFYNSVDNGTVQGSANEDIFFNQGGINLGDYFPLTDAEKATLNNSDPNNWAYHVLLTYKTSIGTDNSVCQLKNDVFARSVDVPETSSSSVVNIDRNGDQPGNGCNVQTPSSFKCDGLTVSALGNNNYSFTALPKVQNVSITSYIFNYGDGISVTSATEKVTHKYAKPGTYTANVKIVTSAGTTQDVCQVAVTIPEVPVAPPAPTTPGVLPKTGAGSVVGIFAAVTIAGAFVHRYLLARQ